MPPTKIRLTRDEFRALLSRFRDPTPALKGIGAYLVSQSQRAFALKRLGSERWPTRYPNQPEPFINVAGALADLRTSGKIKARRFDREPVLRDIGALLNGINFRVNSARTVEVGVFGPARNYASIHQYGRESTQPVTQGAKEALARELRGARGPSRSEAARVKKADRLAAISKLGFLFSVTSLTTKANVRPFIGITPEVRRELPRIVRDYIQAGRI